MLSRKRRVYALGAGASHFAGYPLGKDFWPFVKRLAAKSRTAGASGASGASVSVDDINRVDAVIDDSDNLELLFTLLELTHTGLGTTASIPPALSGAWEILKLGYPGWSNQWDNFRSELIGLITQALLYYQHNLNNFLFPDDEICIAAATERGKSGQSPAPIPACISGQDKGTIRWVFETWARRLKRGDAIISFNWDLLHETVLHRAGKWRWSDGYGFRASNTGGVRASSILIYKLHGSVNWSQETADAAIEITDPEQLFARTPVEKSGVPTIDTDRGRKSLIVPSLLKTPHGRSALLDLWFKAGDALRCAHEIVAVGYSFAAGADTIAYYLFVSSLARNRHRPKVVVVDPGSDGIRTWQRLCQEAGLAEPVYQKLRFEDWVNL